MSDLEQFTIAHRVGADLCVCPGADLRTITAADTQVCPYTCLVEGKQKEQRGQRKQKGLFAFFALFVLFASLANSPSVSHAQAPEARIKVDIDRTIGEVSPHLFGNFAEHLGRMIYGGIYEEGSRLSDADGYRTDVMEAVRQLGVSILRWPGGNFVSGYNWKDGIGPKDQRPIRIE